MTINPNTYRYLCGPTGVNEFLARKGRHNNSRDGALIAAWERYGALPFGSSTKGRVPTQDIYYNPVYGCRTVLYAVRS